MKAVFWDYDGTLVDTRIKNYQVTRKIVKEVSGKDPDEFSLLKSLENYKKGVSKITNWRDIYENKLGFTPEQTDHLGGYWTEFQIRDDTSSPVFDGIKKVLNTFKDLPQAIISQNSRESIHKVLCKEGIEKFFSQIIGYEEVDIRRQKPEPDGLLNCIDTLPSGVAYTIYYVGDHEADVKFARNADRILQSKGKKVKLKSIGALYGCECDGSEWEHQPDYYAATPYDIIKFVKNQNSIE
jgi:HAD superfamily hydrolase (TIGR01549 family)